MKLLIQGDDYGFTKGVTLGILDAAENGVLRNTGLFVNMPESEDAVRRIAEFPMVCLGIDFNIVSGKPVSDPAEIPHLVDQNGEFIRSSVRTRDSRWLSEEGRNEMFPFDETYRELKNQYDRFLALAGKKPEYLHAHSISPENYEKAIRKLSHDEGICYTHDVREKYGMYNFRDGALKNRKVFDPAEQLEKNPLKDFFAKEKEVLAHEYAFVGGHPGFVDADLIGLTTLSLERIRDHQMYTSPLFRKWIEENHADLITYRDLK